MDTTIPETKNVTNTAVVQGSLFEAWPTDLYVPPDALQVFLEGFEGPLDLLLYLIQNQNFDITNIPISTITTQYLKYIELIDGLHLDMAAEYLVMAATLVEIKSRSLLPISEDIQAEDDPRTRLVQQLREYAQYKQAAQNLDALPRLERDLFIGSVEHPDIPRQIAPPEVSLDELLKVMQDVMQRATLFISHQVIKEPLSVRERMSAVLEQLKQLQQIDFVKLFVIEEGRAGVVVTLLAILELTKESLIKIVQSQPFAVIQVVSLET